MWADAGPGTHLVSSGLVPIRVETLSASTSVRARATGWKSSHATRMPFASLGFLVKPVTQCRRPEATGYPFFSSSTFTSNCVPWSSLLFSPNHNCTSSSAVSSDPNASPKSRLSCTSALCHRDVVASGRQLDGAAIGVAGAVSQHRLGRWWGEKRGGLRPPVLQGHADRVVPGIQNEEVEPVSRRRRPRFGGHP